MVLSALVVGATNQASAADEARMTLLMLSIIAGLIALDKSLW